MLAAPLGSLVRPVWSVLVLGGLVGCYGRLCGQLVIHALEIPAIRQKIVIDFDEHVAMGQHRVVIAPDALAPPVFVDASTLRDMCDAMRTS